MPVGHVYNFTGHYICAFHIVAVAACSTEPGLAPEVYMVEHTAIFTHKSSVSVPAAINEFFYILNHCVPKLDAIIYHILKMV